MTATLARPRVHGEVVRRLALAILEGDWAPGERLPNEAELGGRFGVSRTSLREAVRFLSAKGLIEARPRLGMAVRERDAWNLLDPDLLAWQAERGDLEPQLIASLVEARRVIEPAAAALAAERATAADLARIEAAYLAMARSLPADLDACCAADLDFHAEILRATHNLVFRQLIGTMGAALGATMRLSTRLSQAYEATLHVHRDVLEAIRLRDPQAAEARMRALLDLARHDLAPVIGRVP